MLDENSKSICDSVNYRRFSELKNYQQVFENILFASHKMNMENAKFLEQLIATYMGPYVLEDIFRFKNVDIGLKRCFESLQPTPSEKKDFLSKFLSRQEQFI